MLKLLILSVILVSAYGEKIRYDNYALYKVQPEHEDQVSYLNDLEKKNGGLDFWKSVSSVGDYASVVAPPEMREGFEHLMMKRSIRSDLMQSNIQEALESQVYSRKKRSTGAVPELFWTNYQTVDEIYAWFEHLARNHSDVVSLIHAGRSHEGKNITGIRVARGSGSNRRIFVLEGGQVAADWLSPTVITYIADQLIRGQDPEAMRASQDFEWHIFPILNPDGHQFSQDAVRLWMKNRRPTTVGNQVGVDLARNWNSHWGARGGSFQPVASNYVGLGPFSEPETRLFSQYMEGIGNRTTGYLSFRGFGQRFLLPFAHTPNPMYNFNEMITIGRRAMGSLAVRYGTQYLVGSSASVHDGSTGMSADWVKHRFNPPIVATYQLRDQGTFGYILPVNQVLPSCEETFDSLMAILREARFINVL